jgi:N-formylglutamate amidohydrolase
LSEVFTFTVGDSPLLISIPHDGRSLAPGQAESMSEAGLRLPDTDWHVGKLYALACANLDANILAADYSRYVVDLNRPDDDAALYEGQHSTGICPTRTFAGTEIYRSGQAVSPSRKAERIDRYWRPYHEKLSTSLADIVEMHGYALLWDAHSIAGRVPLLFNGSLPDLNIGTNDGQSCAPELQHAVMQVAEDSPFTSVLNGRFRGGYISRHYGDPRRNIHAIQLELVQQNYMDESSFDFNETRAERLAAEIHRMLATFVLAATTTIARA